MSTGLSEFSFSDEIARLKGESSWSLGKRNAITLSKGPLRVVLVLLKEGARLEEHRARGPMTLQVLSGSIRFRSGETGVELAPGRLVVLEAILSHDVEALADAALLLTLMAPV
jgi:quercetin dioxygenase-like cupin family protein